jgi:glycosyltransferase involved in cell wall biosynthesis
VRCHGANTLPGVLRNCRGSRAEALAYGAGLALWQRRLVEQVDAVIVPSVFARERLRGLGAPLPWERVHVLAPPVRALARAASPIGEAVGPAPPDLSAPASGPPMRLPALTDRVESPSGGYALVVSRLAPEKGIDVAIEACRMADVPLVVAGGDLEDATQGARREAEAAPNRVRFVGRVDDTRLAELRAGAALALVPSRSAETFGLAAAEAMAAGVPVAGSRVGALAELLEEQGMAPPGDARALAVAIERVRADAGAGERALRRIRALCAPEVVAERLAEIYGDATALHYARS